MDTGLQSPFKRHPWLEESWPDAKESWDFYEGGRAVLGDRGRSSALSGSPKVFDSMGNESQASHLFAFNAFFSAHNPNLDRHHDEAPEIYSGRIRRAAYENHLSRPVNLFARSIMGSNKIRRDLKRAKWLGDAKEWTEDVDGMGSSIDDFWAMAYIRTFVEDIAYVLVEIPAAPENVRGRMISMAEAEFLGLYPRFRLLTKAQVLNWRLYRTGMARGVYFMEEEDDLDDLMARGKSQSHSVDRWRIRYYTPEYHQAFNLQGTPLTPPIYHNLQVVPIVPLALEWKHRSRWKGLSQVRDATPLSRRIFNTGSRLDEFLFFCALSQFVFQADDPKAVSALRRGASRYWTVPSLAEWPPFCLTPDQAPAEAMRKAINEDIEALFRTFSVRMINRSASADGASGLSKEADALPERRSLAGQAKTMQTAENYAHWLAALWVSTGINLPSRHRNAEMIQIGATYPEESDFDEAALEDQLRRAKDLSLLEPIPKDFWPPYLKPLFQKLLANASEEEIQAIQKKVEEWARQDAPEATDEENLPPSPEEEEVEADLEMISTG